MKLFIVTSLARVISLTEEQSQIFHDERSIIITSCSPGCPACNGKNDECIYATPVLYRYELVDIFMNHLTANEFVAMNADKLFKPKITERSTSKGIEGDLHAYTRDEASLPRIC